MRDGIAKVPAALRAFNSDEDAFLRSIATVMGGPVLFSGGHFASGSATRVRLRDERIFVHALVVTHLHTISPPSKRMEIARWQAFTSCDQRRPTAKKSR
jgi:hypothetical protein